MFTSRSKNRGNLTTLYGSYSSNLNELKFAYQNITTKVFITQPSQDYLDLIKNVFLTTNKDSCDINMLISKDWQDLYLATVRKTRRSFKKNLTEIRNTKSVVDYKYNYNPSSDQFLLSTLSKLKQSISSEVSKRNQPLSLESLEALNDAYQYRYIRLELLLNERSLPLLGKLERALLQELPNYEEIGALEAEAIKLLLSFEKKAKTILDTIKKHEKLLNLYE
jgi:hypothetical protein